jgi:hypothetical protein
MSADREALAQLVNDNHMCTRPWTDLRRNEPAWTRSNGDDYAIAEAYRAADALLATGFRRQGPITDEVCEHEAWDVHGVSRRCADCKAYLAAEGSEP